MENIISLGQIIIPEAMEILERRYNILNAVELYEPIGRRALSNSIGLTERVIRGEVDFLKSNNLLDVKLSGMYITPEGKRILEQLKTIMTSSQIIKNKEKLLKEILHCKQVFIVSGDSKIDSYAKKRIGVEAANYISHILKEGSILALTGGTTVKAFVDSMKPNKSIKDLTVVPARGGIGRDVELQSNTLVSHLATKLDAKYRLLHAPDNITMETHNALLKEEEILSTVNLIKKTSTVVVGIGTAKEMILRRNLPLEEKNLIESRKAVGEAFGSYFDVERTEIYKKIALGLSLDECKNIENVIAVSGGSDKAVAIMSIDFGYDGWVLVTDEGAADEIIRIYDESVM